MSKIGTIAKKVLDVQTVKIDDIIAQYGGIVTINSLNFADYKGNRVPVFGFVEGAGMAFWGGCKKLRELADALLEVYDGNLEAVNDDFQREGVRIRLSPIIKTASGNPFRPVSRLGTVKFNNPQPVDVDPDVDDPDVDEPEIEAAPETGEVVEKEPF